MSHGGNYGIVCLDDNEILVWDIDSAEFRDVLDESLPDTLTVESGGSGVGEHRYYRCRDFATNTSWTDPEGSIRSRNWHTVGPGSVHPDTGSEYRILHNREIATVTVDDLGATMSKLSSREDGGGGGGAGGSSGGGGGGLHGTKKAEDLDIEPTTETLRSLGFINSESRRREIAKVFDHRHPPRHVRVWAGGFLHSVCGLTRSQLEKLLREQAGWATDGNRIKTEVRSLIQSSINNRRADESVNLDRYLGPDDMDGDTSESRKTEESGKGRTLQGGVLKMVNDNVNNHVTEKNGSVVVRSGVVHVDPEASDNQWDYMGLLFGEIEEDEEDLGTIVNWEYDQYSNKDYKNLGNRDPEELRQAAKALEQLADKIED
jgi:hypothetical protein